MRHTPLCSLHCMRRAPTRKTLFSDSLPQATCVYIYMNLWQNRERIVGAVKNKIVFDEMLRAV